MQTVDREAAIAIIREIATNYVHSHARSPNTIIVVGGTAMALRRLRDESEDIDIFYPDDALRIIAEDIERRSGFRIDVTSKNNLWGQLRIQDIEQDAEVVESIDIEGFAVDIAAISPETLFVIKASSMREKDRDDLPLLTRVTTQQEIITRAEYLLKTLETRHGQEEFLANIVAEMQLVYLEAAKPEWFAQARELALEHNDFLKEQFGIDISEHGLQPGSAPEKNNRHIEPGSPPVGRRRGKGLR